MLKDESDCINTMRTPTPMRVGGDPVFEEIARDLTLYCKQTL